MTSRERVLTALDHREPDKIPIDLGGTICSTISATANDKLKKFLNINKDGEIIIHPFLDVVLPLPETKGESTYEAYMTAKKYRDYSILGQVDNR
jgi:hypothetical protein